MAKRRAQKQARKPTKAVRRKVRRDGRDAGGGHVLGRSLRPRRRSVRPRLEHRDAQGEPLARGGGPARGDGIQRAAATVAASGTGGSGVKRRGMWPAQQGRAMSSGSSTGPPLRILAEASSIGSRRTIVAFSSRAFG